MRRREKGLGRKGQGRDEEEEKEEEVPGSRLGLLGRRSPLVIGQDCWFGKRKGPRLFLHWSRRVKTPPRLRPRMKINGLWGSTRTT